MEWRRKKTVPVVQQPLDQGDDEAVQNNGDTRDFENTEAEAGQVEVIQTQSETNADANARVETAGNCWKYSIYTYNSSS